MRSAGLVPLLALSLFACGDDPSRPEVRGPDADGGLVLRPGDGLFASPERLIQLEPRSAALPDVLAELVGPVPVRTPELRAADWTEVHSVPDEYVASLEELGATLWRTRTPIPAGAYGAPRVVVDGVLLDGEATSLPSRPGLHVAWEASTGYLLGVSRERPAGVALDIFVDAESTLRPQTSGENVLRRLELGDETRRVFELPAPGRAGLRVERLEGDALDVAVGVEDAGYRVTDGVLERASGVSDGVTFALDVVEDPEHGGTPVRAWSLYVGAEGLGRFVEARIDLSRWTGRSVELQFVTEPGQAGDQAFDRAVWGEPRVRGARSAPPTRPHVVLIDVDTLRADRLGVYDDDSTLTPRLDTWARRHAVVHIDCTATASWTLPSTSSLLTGLAVHQHGVDRATVALGSDVKTLASLLRAAGYETRAVAAGGYLRPAFGFDTGFDVYTTVEPKDLPWSATLALLSEKRSERPTFLFLHTYLVHAPYPHDAAFAEATYDGPLAGEDVEHETVIDPWVAGELQLDASDEAYVADMYDALVARMDAEVGAFLEQLELALDGDPCLVIFTSDHGEAFFEHGLLGHGSGLYSEQLHVPLIVRFPAGRPGSTNRPATLLDVVPTVLDVVGLEVPEGLAGRSLRRPWTGKARVRVAQLQNGMRAVTSEGTKLLEGPGEGGTTRIELFELAEDPREQRDVSRAEPEQVAELRKRFEWFLATYPPQADALVESALDDNVTAQLRALGYLGDD